MRKLPVVILLVLVALSLVTSVTGCHRAQRYDSRLVAADSLMRRFPDSALAIVEALCPDSLAAEGDRAYRALLLTQARYKSYIPATSDSAISRALAYYCAHPKEREKLTRAYIYKGAVMEELDHPDSAMLYYKHAEATADPDDYFNLGYINMRIGELYQGHYDNDSAIVLRMKRASRYFTLIRDTDYLITTIGTQGAFPEIIGKDSARYYLSSAIKLAKDYKSPKEYQYRSKLAGIYFYDGDFRTAKDMAMYIVLKGRQYCNENQFYYYAARSFLRLNQLDSARYVISIIPSPVNAVDSMNHYQTLAELSQAKHLHSDYQRYNNLSEDIHTRIYENARCSNLIVTELEWNASKLKKDLSDEADSHLAIVIGLFICGILLLLAIVYAVINNLEKLYSSKLNHAQQDVEKLINDLNNSQNRFSAEREHYRQELSQITHELENVNKEKDKLELEHINISEKVSKIVRYRLAALAELYQNMRIKPEKGDTPKQLLPLLTTIKELYEKRGLLHTPPNASFWNNLRLSVDGEYRGIVSFVEKKYPDLSEKDIHLLILACANFPNPIIKICMNLTSDVTVSKKKKKLLKEKIGLDVKFEEFIQLYLRGDLENL